MKRVVVANVTRRINDKYIILAGSEGDVKILLTGYPFISNIAL
jgi:hypothetical protein